MQNIIDVAKEIHTPSALTQEQGDIIFNTITSFFEKKKPLFWIFLMLKA